MKPLRSLLLACLLALNLLNSAALDFAPTPTALAPRQILPSLNTGTGTGTASSTAAAESSTTSSTTSSSSATSTSSSDTSTTSSTEETTSSTTTSSTPAETSTPTPTQNSTSPPQNNSPSAPAPPVQTSVLELTTTGADGQASTVTITSTNTPSPTSSTSSTPSAAPKDPDDSKLGVGSIVGMSVAGGVAVLGIVGFFVWKFTRKRFTDFDDHEAIKWPELNAHSGAESNPLPPREPARALDSESDLSRFNSTNYSTPDFNSVDPYAVPPLPHMNPNQPYRDDPTGATGYYDPYRGPVPGTLENGGSSVGHEWTGGEAIPMNQMHAGRMSPGPQAALRTMSPAPQYGAEGMYEAGPQAAMGGRASPGPQMAYSGRASPGPQMAYGGRASPGPNMAYDHYGAGAR